jgi:high-affinity K+ transport system ATPase subunit B
LTFWLHDTGDPWLDRPLIQKTASLRRVKRSVFAGARFRRAIVPLAKAFIAPTENLVKAHRQPTDRQSQLARTRLSGVTGSSHKAVAAGSCKTFNRIVQRGKHQRAVKAQPS